MKASTAWSWFISAFLTLSATLTAYAQPHYSVVGSLPVPTATDRLEVFDPGSGILLSTPNYDNGYLSDGYVATHTSGDSFSFQRLAGLGGRYWNRLTTDGRHVYSSGGYSNDTVDYVSLSSLALSPSWQSATPIPGSVDAIKRALHQAVIFKDRLYILGGWHGDALPGFSDLHVAPILPDGSLGNFVSGLSLPAPMAGGSTVVSPEGRLYLVSKSSIYQAQIAADGFLGSFQLQVAIPGLNHVNSGNNAVTLLDNRLIIVDDQTTWVCGLDRQGQVTGLMASLAHPERFAQRYVYSYKQKVYVTATTGKIYRLDGIGPNTTWDNFTQGLGTWSTTAGWSLQTSSPGQVVLNANTQGELFAWKTNVTLATSWAVETQVELKSLYNDGNGTGTVGFALGDSNLNLLGLAEVIYRRDGWIYPAIGYWTGAWKDSLTNHPWVPGATNTLTLRLERPPGRNNLIFTISSPTGLRVQYVSQDIPDSIWSQIQRIGFRAFKVDAAFSYLSVKSPLPPAIDIALYPALTLRGEPGTSYKIEYTTPLAPAQWVAATNVTLSTPTMLWFDTTWTNREQRFYRAVQQP